MENYKKLIYDLLESTPTKVCISSIIPIPGYPDLDRDIGRTNKEVVDFVTSLRKSAAYKDRIFCSSNNRVGGYVTREVGSHGIELFVGDRGRRILWLTLKDSIRRCLAQTAHGKQRPGDQHSHKSRTLPKEWTQYDS